MTPWKSSSRTASRRTDPPAALASAFAGAFAGTFAAALAAALALAAAPASCQGLTVRASRASDAAMVTAFFSWEKEADLVVSLRDGLESRITFSLRAFERASGPFAFLGDRLLGEKTVTRSAYFDFLDGRFVIEEADGSRAGSPDLPSMLAAFFTAARIAVPAPVPAGGGSCYAAARVSFEPVKLMPPLTIVSLAGAAVSHVTPWVTAELPR